MKKNFIAIAVALLTLGGTISAQSPETSSTENTTTSATCQKQCRRDRCNDNKQCNRDGKREGRRHGHGHRPDMFAGIQLTAEQQQAIDNLRKENQANREQARKERQTQRRLAREQQQAKRAEQLKAILTPEQYAQYEQNVAAAKAQRETMTNDTAGVMKSRHNMRRGDKKQRGENTPRHYRGTVSYKNADTK